MTLDDYFTLTEMNNGLTAPSRVNELVSIMQMQKDHIVKNVNEATRQWSAVGSAIAATENRECLDLFIRLDGLRFLGGWLREARKFGNDPNNPFLDESVARLLQALKQLRAGREKLVSSEVWTAVEDLLSHSSSKVRDEARALFESWKKTTDDGETVESLADDDDDEKGKKKSRDDLFVATGSTAVHAVGENCKSDNLSNSLPSLPNFDSETVYHSVGTDSSGLCNPAKIETATENLGSGEKFNTSESKPEVEVKLAITDTRDKTLCGEGSSCIDIKKIDSDEKGTTDEAAEKAPIEMGTETLDHEEQNRNSSKKPDAPEPESRNPSQAGEKSDTWTQEESETPGRNLDKNPCELGREETNMDRSLCDFDLNQDVRPDDADHRISMPVPIVSASRAATARGPLSSALQFEGNLGLKISASSSAFRPASPRWAPLNEKQAQGCLDFDLNSSENTEAGGSLDLGLDLNLTGEDGSQPIPRPPVGMNLNDRTAQNFDLFGGSLKVEDSAISIMGKRVEMENDKGSVYSPVLGFPNGRAHGQAYDVRAGTVLGMDSVIPFSHYGNSDVVAGPSGPFPSAMYGPVGPINYLTDSRGAPVVPQILGTPSLPSGFSQTPLSLNLMGPNPSNALGTSGPLLNGPDGVGPSRGSLDLNFGMGEGGSWNPVGFLQFLSPSGVGPMEEQQKPDSQPSMSSVVGGKRKEPDTGWENYPFKHYTPPWK